MWKKKKKVFRILLVNIEFLIVHLQITVENQEILVKSEIGK